MAAFGLDSLLSDGRWAIRALQRTPGVAVLAVLSIGLGVGAVTTIYSTASAFTFRPLPQVRDAGRMMYVWESPAEDPRRSETMSAGALEDVRRLPVFSGVGAFQMWDANVAGVDVPERVNAARVTANFLRVLGRAPVVGRDFAAAEDAPGASRVVLLGHGLWQRRFGGDSSVVGAAVRISGQPYTVVGILPEDFVFPTGSQLLVPLGLGPEAYASRRDRRLIVAGRLARGVSQSEAQAAIAALGSQLASAYPEASAGWVLLMEPLEDTFGRGPRPFMFVLLASVGFVLLIGCANVANLLLVRATVRRREMAMRVALGASRPRIVRQLLTESTAIAIAGGAVGALLALWGIEAMAAAVPVEVHRFIPGFGQIRLDARALGVAALVAAGSALLFGLAPALAAADTDLQGALRDGGRGTVSGRSTGRLRSTLVVTEIALALVLLFGAQLMVATSRRLLNTDPGFLTHGVLTLGVTLPETDYASDSAVASFATRLEDDVAQLPGIEAAGATTVLPLSWGEHRTAVEVDGQPLRRREDAPVIGLRLVSAGYLAALQVQLLRGRLLSRDDDARHPAVAVISEAAARRLWRGEEAVGRRLRVRDQRWVEIVGVVGNVRGNPLVTDDPAPVLYLPMRQWPARSFALVVRTPGEPTALAPAVQRAIAGLDARLAAGDVVPMPRVVLAAVSPQRATAQTLVAAAVLALVMAAVGTYGVIAYAVAQRTHEIGVRVALGATGADVVRLVLRQALVLAAGGIAVGIAGALLMGRTMRAILYETDAGDPVAVGSVALVLAVVALVASVVPARRALRVDPMDVLRTE